MRLRRAPGDPGRHYMCTQEWDGLEPEKQNGKLLESGGGQCIRS